MSEAAKKIALIVTLTNGKRYAIASDTSPLVFIASLNGDGFKYYELYTDQMDYNVHCKLNRVAINARDISSVEYYEKTGDEDGVKE